MKNLKCLFSALCLSFFILAFALCFSNKAYAVLFCNHGHSGHVEYESLISDQHYSGWGLDFDMVPGSVNWVHFSIPTVADMKVSNVKLNFVTGSNDALVDNVVVYNGGKRVKTFEFQELSGDLGLITLELEDRVLFTSVGITVKISTGVEEMSHHYTFYEVCADFKRNN